MKAIADVRKRLQNLIDVKLAEAELVLPDIINDLYSIEADMEEELKLYKKIEDERDELQGEVNGLKSSLEPYENLSEIASINTLNGNTIDVYTANANMLDEMVFETLKELYEIRQLTPQQIIDRLNAVPHAKPAEAKKVTATPAPAPTPAPHAEAAPVNPIINDKTEPMHITVELTANPELLQVLRDLVPAAARSAAAPSANGKAKNGTAKETAKIEDAPAPAETPKGVKTAVTKEQLRLAVRSKSQAGKKDAVKALLSDFGTDSVSNLQEEQHADFLAKVEAL